MQQTETLIFVLGRALDGLGEGSGRILEGFREDFGRVSGLADCELTLILPKRRFCKNHRFP